MTKLTRALVVIGVSLLSIAMLAAAAHGQEDRPQAQAPTVKELLERYDCKWLAEQRKYHTDEELRQMAEEMHLPKVLIRMAEKCPR